MQRQLLEGTHFLKGLSLIIFAPTLGMVPGTRHRLVQLPRPKKWSLNFPLTTSYKCPVATGRYPGSVTAAAVDVADACAAAGFSPARHFPVALAARSYDTATTATLAFCLAFFFFFQSFYARLQGSGHPTARHSGFCDVVCCPFGTTFDARVEWDAKSTSRGGALQAPYLLEETELCG